MTILLFYHQRYEISSSKDLFTGHHFNLRNPRTKKHYQLNYCDKCLVAEATKFVKSITKVVKMFKVGKKVPCLFLSLWTTNTCFVCPPYRKIFQNITDKTFSHILFFIEKPYGENLCNWLLKVVEFYREPIRGKWHPRNKKVMKIELLWIKSLSDFMNCDWKYDIFTLPKNFSA